MNWKDSFRSALIELDPAKLMARIHETETAITKLSKSSSSVLSTDEMQAMNDAMCTLGILKNHFCAETGPRFEH